MLGRTWRLGWTHGPEAATSGGGGRGVLAWWPRSRHSSGRGPRHARRGRAPCCARPGRARWSRAPRASMTPRGSPIWARRRARRRTRPRSVEMGACGRTIVGDFDGSRGVTEETSDPRDATRSRGCWRRGWRWRARAARAEDDRARMASLVDAGLSLGRELAPRRPADPDRAVGADRARRALRGARGARLHRDGARPVRHGRHRPRSSARPIGPLPRGRGILGVLIRDARPAAARAPRRRPALGGLPAEPPADGRRSSACRSPCAARPSATSTSPTRPAGPFTEEDEQIALTLAAQAAVAVDNVRRYEAERRRADEIESVQEVARAVLDDAGHRRPPARWSPAARGG